MPFKFVTRDGTTSGDLSIIPNQYREEALHQYKSALKCHLNGWYCPISIVGLGESIAYELSDEDSDNILNLTETINTK